MAGLAPSVMYGVALHLNRVRSRVVSAFEFCGIVRSVDLRTVLYDRHDLGVEDR